MNNQQTDTTPVHVLAGDIGGTNTRLAVFDVGGTHLETVVEQTYPSQAHAALGEIIQDFTARHSVAVTSACFGIAGPVHGDTVRTTNLPWHISAGEIAERFGITRVFLLNDLEANAWGIRALGAGDFCSLQAGAGDAEGNCAIISAGTGLGEAGLYHDGTELQPFASEGGHTDFSPGNEQEIELLRFLQQRYDHVSWERLLSGPGLVHIHEFLRHYRKSDVPAWLTDAMRDGDPAVAISTAGLAQRDAVCAEALELFAHLYGVEAGNLALKILARGGIYIGGGIAPKILDVMQGGAFINAFLDKGRMRPLLEKIPVQIILNDKTALYGPGIFAARNQVQS
ncbi:MAG: glucokinase [Gammaproteobacteria bacterium]